MNLEISAPARFGRDVRVCVMAASLALASSIGAVGVGAQSSLDLKGDPGGRPSVFQAEAAALRTTIIPSPSAANAALLGPSLFLPRAPSSERRDDEAGRDGADAAADGSGAAARPVEPVEPVGPVARQEDVWTDAWGQEKNFGLAAVTAYLGNFLPWVFNEVVPGRAELKISQISPRSWWRNIEHGFDWDDNAFEVNHFAHPFQGSIYYNGARGNGYSYWAGLLFATAGSYHWECCGETHLMSVNDWYNTAIGGAAVGEMLYRTSSMVLDNTARGSERAWREIGAFAMAPTRGFSRLVTGNATRVYANPEHPSDRIPNRLENVLSYGIRRATSERRAGEIYANDGRQAHPFFDLQLISGSPYDLDRQKPFDFFTFTTQINFRQEVGLGKLQIRGNLWHKTQSERENGISKLLLVQEFDYENNSAFEFGGQSVSFMFLKRTERSARTSFTWNVAGTWMIMGGVNSEFASLADIGGIRERLREYDFGTGLGANAGFSFLRDGYRWIEGSYRVQHLSTLNGSNLNGQDANHIIQFLKLRAAFPLNFKRFGAGAEYELFLRDSFFAFEDFSKIEQRVPRWQVFFTWNPTRVVN